MSNLINQIAPSYCTIFNPAQLLVQNNDVYHSGQLFLNFRNPQDAQKAIETINHYKMNQICRIAPSFFFFLSGNRAPTGIFRGEDVLSFNPRDLNIENKGTYFLITSGRQSMFSFDNLEKAKLALDAIIKYGFDTSCFVGRPNPGMMYLKSKEPISLDKPFLIRVEEVSNIQGLGTVAFGRIKSGVIKLGDKVQITGHGAEAKKTIISGIKILNNIVDVGHAGDEVGLILRGIRVEEVKRGMIISHLSL